MAADVGVYRIDDAGNSWELFNPGLPNVLVKDLALHAPSRLLRAGTQARGVWEIPVDEATLPAVEIYLRDNAVDTGRLSPSPFGADDPFAFGAQTVWWQSVDIKVDSMSLCTPALDEVDFELFGDDQSMIGISDNDRDIQFAGGLLPENLIRSQVNRVYVRVNNRGISAASNVAVHGDLRRIVVAISAVAPAAAPVPIPVALSGIAQFSRVMTDRRWFFERIADRSNHEQYQHDEKHEVQHAHAQ